MNILVLGVGSVLMKDEGIGVLAVGELAKRYGIPDNVELLDGGTSGMDLLTHIAGRDCLIIIDAIRSGNPPGSVLRVEGEDVPARFGSRISPHQIGITDLLAAAALTGETPRHMVLFGVEPKEISLGIGLSNEVTAGMERLLKVVVDELGKWGCSVAPACAVSREKSFWEQAGV